MQRNGRCTQLEKNRTLCFCCKLFSDVNAALSIDRFSDWSASAGVLKLLVLWSP